MIGVIVLSHGEMAEGMVKTSKILRKTERGLLAVCLEEEHSPQDFDRMITEAAEAVDEGDGVLFMADINGGTPANRALLMADKREDMAVVAGVNLPMLLEVLNTREYSDMAQLYALLEEVAVRTIAFPSDKILAGAGRSCKNAVGESDELDKLDALLE